MEIWNRGTMEELELDTDPLTGVDAPEGVEQLELPVDRGIR